MILMEKVIEKNSIVVVGIDPVIDRFPEYIKDGFDSSYGKLMVFGKEIIDGVYDVVPAVKFQIAYFESYGLDGMRAFKDLIAYAKEKKLYVIADVKRGDIGSTAEAYARAYFSKGSDFEVDCITINPYLGDDNNNAFYNLAKENDKGVFVLVKTSNNTSGQLQDLKSDNQEIYKYVANNIKENKFYETDHIYSGIGAVVGATYPKQLSEIREMLPQSVFLIPGYGAQGGKAEDIKGAFDSNGLGAVVNSSRGIIYSYEKFGLSISKSSRKAAIEMRDDINQWRL
ncbi:MAG: orotidine-5'-phosphate decarboxylase [Clostridiales bacterium]|nr:orotidine-5'-phosphate decarboxylase [Clostridiales bacterium]